jgi:hypothetical protein
MISYNGYERPNYSILWHTSTHRFLLFGHDDINELIYQVERWYQKKPRIKQQPKIVCNATGRVVYD